VETLAIIARYFSVLIRCYSETLNGISQISHSYYATTREVLTIIIIIAAYALLTLSTMIRLSRCLLTTLQKPRKYAPICLLHTINACLNTCKLNWRLRKKTDLAMLQTPLSSDALFEMQLTSSYMPKTSTKSLVKK
jgi:uncharacterized membrane protein YidH (DUF202 family)